MNFHSFRVVSMYKCRYLKNIAYNDLLAGKNQWVTEIMFLYRQDYIVGLCAMNSSLTSWFLNTAGEISLQTAKVKTSMLAAS